MRLYEISNNYQRIADAIENSDEISTELLQELDAVEQNMSAKIENIGALIANLECEAQAIDEVIERQFVRQKRVNKKIENLKDYIKFELERCGINKMSTPQFDLSIRANPPSVVIQDESSIPEKYFKDRIMRSLDKSLISQDLKNNCDIPGVILERRTRIDIR